MKICQWAVALFIAMASQQARPDAAALPFKFSAFIDVRFTNYDSEERLSGAARAESGFGIEDGAFYLNYDHDKLSFVGDIAFRRGKDSDFKDSPTTPNQSSNNFIGLGVDRSQLYLRYKILPSLTFDFGQWDTIYGVELNDSKDRVFGKTGILYDNMLPVTHTGAKVEYTCSGGFYGKAFAANPNNKGSYGTSTTGDQNTEYGGALGFSNAMFRAQAGYMSRPIAKADGTGNDNRTLLDVTAGATFGSFALDLEYAVLNDPSKNTLTSGNSNDEEDDGNAIFALLSYKITDAFLVGARYEVTKNDPLAAGSAKDVTSYGLSVHYKLASDLEMRSEYIMYKNESLTREWDDSRFNVAALATF